jgi:hypothetical protein
LSFRNQEGLAMANWIKCTTMDGASITINVEHVAAIRPHNRDRGGTGCEIIFAGSPTSVIVKEDEERLTQTARP